MATRLSILEDKPFTPTARDLADFECVRSSPNYYALAELSFLAGSLETVFTVKGTVSFEDYKILGRTHAGIDRELAVHNIDPVHYYHRQQTLHSIRAFRRLEIGDFIPAADMDPQSIRAAAEALLSARPATPAMMMAHYNLLELAWGIEAANS